MFTSTNEMYLIETQSARAGHNPLWHPLLIGAAKFSAEEDREFYRISPDRMRHSGGIWPNDLEACLAFRSRDVALACYSSILGADPTRPLRLNHVVCLRASESLTRNKEASKIPNGG